jgi:hypothetical protein
MLSAGFHVTAALRLSAALGPLLISRGDVPTRWR